MRQYIRHPLDVPIEIRAGAAWASPDPQASEAEASSARPAGTRTTSSDISCGGLAVHAEAPLSPGALIDVRIPYVEPAFEARARVAWCRPGRSGGHELGVAFLDAEDAFMARMVEQVCYIQDYQRSVARLEGRQISAEEAAREWIAKYADRFPGAGAAVGNGARLQ